MKQKQLELKLQTLQPPTNPKPYWEQYQTPASIAADILYQAYGMGDIQDKHVIDLGCGTGIFAIGAAILGAQQVTGIDIDKDSIAYATQQAQPYQNIIDFIIQPIDQVTTKGDTVLMNPPFGAQKSNQQMDRRFLEKAIDLSHTIYTIHLQKTYPFLQQLINATPATITHTKTYHFPLPHQFSFHTKTKKMYDVILLRLTK